MSSTLFPILINLAILSAFVNYQIQNVVDVQTRATPTFETCYATQGES